MFFALQVSPAFRPFVLILLLVFGAIVALIELRVIQYAYQRIGIDRRYVFSVLLLSLLGSYLNIPVAVLAPTDDLPATVVEVNVGGAIIPTLLSLFLFIKGRDYWRPVVATIVVTVLVNWIAYPIPNEGIATPIFLPPLAAAFSALILSRKSAPQIAYIAGCMGTLLGADVLNLWRVQALGSAAVSIGGAGTFDGVFLTGIIAVLLA
ncbi:MAG TPA: DUF1614 domain-containing protein [Planctomycetaceae bacterium]|nr:DUF1614 domain-containing protein [Planctomycetaceae bacterium]